MSLFHSILQKFLNYFQQIIISQIIHTYIHSNIKYSRFRITTTTTTTTTTTPAVEKALTDPYWKTASILLLLPLEFPSFFATLPALVDG